MTIRSVLARVAAAAAVVAGVPLTMVATAPPAFACSCATSAFADHVARAAVVFAGTVTGDGDRRGGVLGGSTADLVEWPFQVDAVHKGAATAEQLVLSEQSSASCGYEFGVGRTYLVLGTVVGGTVRTNLCSGTAELSDVPSADVEALGPGAVPAAAQRPAADATTAGAADDAVAAESPTTTIVAAVALGLVLVGGVAAFAVRRRRSA